MMLPDLLYLRKCAVRLEGLVRLLLIVRTAFLWFRLQMVQWLKYMICSTDVPN